jgi:hypothetical protein
VLLERNALGELGESLSSDWIGVSASAVISLFPRYAQIRDVERGRDELLLGLND